MSTKHGISLLFWPNLYKTYSQWLQLLACSLWKLQKSRQVHLHQLTKLTNLNSSYFNFWNNKLTYLITHSQTKMSLKQSAFAIISINVTTTTSCFSNYEGDYSKHEEVQLQMTRKKVGTLLGRHGSSSSWGQAVIASVCDWIRHGFGMNQG